MLFAGWPLLHRSGANTGPHGPGAWAPHVFSKRVVCGYLFAQDPGVLLRDIGNRQRPTQTSSFLFPLVRPGAPLVASLLLVAMPGATSGKNATSSDGFLAFADCLGVWPEICIWVISAFQHFGQLASRRGIQFVLLRSLSTLSIKLLLSVSK